MEEIFQLGKVVIVEVGHFRLERLSLWRFNQLYGAVRVENISDWGRSLYERDISAWRFVIIGNSNVLTDEHPGECAPSLDSETSLVLSNLGSIADNLTSRELTN